MKDFKKAFHHTKSSFKEFFNQLSPFNEKLLPEGKSFEKEAFGLYPLSEYLQYECYDEVKEIYHCTEAKGIVIETEPLSGASLHHLEALYSLLQRTLPEGTILHCLLYASPFIGSALEAYVKVRENHHPLTQTLAQKRATYWKRGAFQSLVSWQPVVLRDYRLLLCLVFDDALGLSELKIAALKNHLQGVLKSLSLSAHSVKPSRFLSWIEALLRPTESLYPANSSYSALTPLASLLAAPHHQKQIFPDHILIDEGEWQIRNFRVEEYGKESPQLAQMSDFIGHLFEVNAQIGCPFSLSFVVKICHAAEENGKAARLAFRALQRAEVIGKFSPKSIRDAVDARAIVSEIEKSERLVLASFQISLYCKTSDAAEQESNLLSVFQSADFRWKLLKNTGLQPVMLLAHLPLNQNFHWLQDLEKLGLLYKLWARNAAGMLPMVAEPKGMNIPSLMIAGRRGQIFFFDPFGNPHGNYNTCVAGIAGSGKSVVVQELANAFVGTGGKVFIIDIGRSYQKLCASLNGEFIEFNSKSSLCLNPFTKARAEEVLEFYDFLVNFLDALINPLQGLSLFERACVEKAVKKTWEAKGNQGSITDVAEFLLQSDDVRSQDLGTALYPYTVLGQYGRFLNGEATVDFSNPLVVFELEEISGNKLLQSIVFMLLMYHVTEKMYLGNRKTRIVLIIDEAWTMLKGGQGGAIIENIARKARKYKGALITITQSVMDYFLSEASQAAFTNSYWKIILMQNKGDIETLVAERKLPLNPFQKRLLCSLKTEHGAYSEMMILGDGEECVVGRLFLDPYSRVLYSTQASDFAAINELRQQGISLSDAIEIIAKRNFPGEDYD